MRKGFLEGQEEPLRPGRRGPGKEAVSAILTQAVMRLGKSSGTTEGRLRENEMRRRRLKVQVAGNLKEFSS